MKQHIALYTQRLAIRWVISCVNPASWLPLATKREFTQPRAHLLAQLCTRFNVKAMTNIGPVSIKNIFHFPLARKHAALPLCSVGQKLHIALCASHAKNIFQTVHVHTNKDGLTSWLYWSLMLTGLILILHCPSDRGRRRIGIWNNLSLSTFWVAVNSSKVSIGGVSF